MKMKFFSFGGKKSTLDAVDFVIENGKLTKYTGSPHALNIKIPDGVKIIGKYSFAQKFDGDITLSLPSSVEVIAEYAFYNCHFREINFEPNSRLCKIEKSAFTNCEIDELILPKSITDVNLLGAEVRNLRFINGTQIKTLFFPDLMYTIILPDISSGIKAKTIEPYCMGESIHVFYQGTVTDENRKFFRNFKYVYESIDIDHITHNYNNGVEYFETADGIVIVNIDNRIAKLEKVPSQYLGKQVLYISIDDLEYEQNSLEFTQKLGNLYPKLKELSQYNLSCIDNAFSLITKDMNINNFNSPTYNLFDSTDSNCSPLTHSKIIQTIYDCVPKNYVNRAIFEISNRLDTLKANYSALSENQN